MDKSALQVVIPKIKATKITYEIKLQLVNWRNRYLIAYEKLNNS